ncbi:hypothetical protein PENTCL1PPCAC_1908, partial [Pristionchus entomophagus]
SSHPCSLNSSSSFSLLYLSLLLMEYGVNGLSSSPSTEKSTATRTCSTAAQCSGIAQRYEECGPKMCPFPTKFVFPSIIFIEAKQTVRESVHAYVSRYDRLKWKVFDQDREGRGGGGRSSSVDEIGDKQEFSFLLPVLVALDISR